MQAESSDSQNAPIIVQWSLFVRFWDPRRRTLFGARLEFLIPFSTDEDNERKWQVETKNCANVDHIRTPTDLNLQPRIQHFLASRDQHQTCKVKVSVPVQIPFSPDASAWNLTVAPPWVSRAGVCCLWHVQMSDTSWFWKIMGSENKQRERSLNRKMFGNREPGLIKREGLVGRMQCSWSHGSFRWLHFFARIEKYIHFDWNNWEV